MLEQVELLGGRRDQLIAAPHLARRQVHQDVGVAKRSARTRRAPAKQRPHPGEQFLVSKGLDQVVVGAAVQALDAVGRAILGGQQQDRDIAFGPEPSRNLEAVDARHHDVEDGEVGHALAGAGQRDLAVGRDFDLVTLVDQGATQRGRDLGIVVHDQDVGLLGHARHHLSTLP